MKKLFFILGILTSFIVSAQQYRPPTLYGVRETRMVVTSLIGIPNDTLHPTNYPGYAHLATKNGALYWWNPYLGIAKWVSVGTGGGGGEGGITQEQLDDTAYAIRNDFKDSIGAINNTISLFKQPAFVGSWKFLSDSVTIHARDGAELVYIPSQDSLYLFGGWHRDSVPASDNEVYKYDKNMQHWRRLPDAPWTHGLHDFGIHYDGVDSIFIWGGDAENIGTQEYWVFKVSTGAWTLLKTDILGSAGTSNRVNYGAVWFNNRPWMIGGITGAETDSTTTPNDIVRGPLLNKTGNWQQALTGQVWLGANLAGSAASFNGYIYIVAGVGWSLNEYDRDYRKSVWRSQDGFTWERRADVPFVVNGYFGTGRGFVKLMPSYDGNNLGLFFGYQRIPGIGIQDFRECWIMNKDEQWTRLAQIPVSMDGRHAAAVAAVPDGFIVSNGFLDNDAWKLQAYDGNIHNEGNSFGFPMRIGTRDSMNVELWMNDTARIKLYIDSTVFYNRIKIYDRQPPNAVTTVDHTVLNLESNATGTRIRFKNLQDSLGIINYDEVGMKLITTAQAAGVEHGLLLDKTGRLSVGYNALNNYDVAGARLQVWGGGLGETLASFGGRIFLQGDGYIKGFYAWLDHTELTDDTTLYKPMGMYYNGSSPFNGIIKRFDNWGQVTGGGGGGTSYIQNQNSVAQTGNFRINGTGRLEGGYLYGETTNSYVRLDNTVGSQLSYSGTHNINADAGGIHLFGNTASYTEQLTVSGSNGFVGINDNTPDFMLDVEGTLGVAGVTTLANLAGTGTRYVTATSAGVLGSVTIPNTIYTGDGTLAGNRTVTQAGFSQTFSGGSFNLVTNTSSGSQTFFNIAPGSFALTSAYSTGNVSEQSGLSPTPFWRATADDGGTNAAIIRIEPTQIILTPKSNIRITTLDTDLTPHTTSGTTKMVITDNNGDLSFANIPSAGGGGTVTSVSVASANGFAGTSDGNATTPQLTISTTVTGLLKGNATAISAAVAGTDYVTPQTTLSGYGITDAASNGATSVQDIHFGDIYLKDDVTPSHYLKITDNDNLTAARTLSITMNDADRTMTLNGNTTLSGTNTGDQAFSITGDVTASSSTSVLAATIPSSVIDLGDIKNIAAHRILGNNTASAAAPAELTGTQTTAELDVFTSALKGLAPASGGGTTNYLRADGTWAAPPGGGSGADALGRYIVQIATNAPANAQILASLSTGIVKNTTTTGVLSIATAGTDYVTPQTTLSGYGITDALSSSTSSVQDAYHGDVYLRDDVTPSHYLKITDNDNLTAARTLSIVVNDASRTLTFNGDATISGTNTGDQTLAGLSGLGDPGANGIVVRTAANTSTARSITGVANQIVITNGDGTGGNINVAPGGDMVIETGSNTWVAGTKQIFTQNDAATAILRITPQSADPSTLGDGDIWNDTETGFKGRVQGVTRQYAWSALAGITAASAAINTTETNLVNASIPANTLQVGTTYRITWYGTCTSTVANASNLRVRIGTANTTADAVVAVITPTAAASGTTVPFQASALVTIRSTGAGTGTSAGNGSLNNNGVTGISAAADVIASTTTISTLNTTVANTISVWYVSAASTTTSTFQQVLIEAVKL